MGLAVYNNAKVRIGMVKGGKFIGNVNFRPETDDEISAEIAVEEYNREQSNIPQEEVEIKEGGFERADEDSA